MFLLYRFDVNRESLPEEVIILEVISDESELLKG